MALGNLTGNGIPDIVMCGVGGNDDLAVYMNNGNGTFQTPAQYPIGGHTNLGCVALADLTGTGICDIIVTDGNASTVDVLIGNGDGTFQTPVTYPAGGAVGGGWGSHGMVVADLTGNGLPDIVDVNSNGVSVLMNQGNGAFGPATTFAAGSGLNSVAVADLNGDGIPDIVASNPVSNAVTVLLGPGSGGFGTPQSYSTGAACHGVCRSICHYGAALLSSRRVS